MHHFADLKIYRTRKAGEMRCMMLKIKGGKKSLGILKISLDKKSESGTISFVENYASATPGRFAFTAEI